MILAYASLPEALVVALLVGIAAALIVIGGELLPARSYHELRRLELAPTPVEPRSNVTVTPARPFDWRTDDPELGDRFTPARIAELFDVPPELVGIATRGDGSPLRRPAT